MADKKNINLEEEEEQGFFARIFSMLFGGGDSKAEKKRKIKQIGKEISHSKYRFMKVQNEEITPQMAKFFYEIYKVISPAQILFRSIQNPNALRSAVIFLSFNDKQREMFDKVSEDYIKERARHVSFNELESEIKRNFEELLDEFDALKIAKIDKCYNDLMMLRTFCDYDFYFFLKNFDLRIIEHSFTSNPTFNMVAGNSIVDDLKDILELLYSIDFATDWEPVLKILKDYKGTAPMELRQWKGIVSKLEDLRTSGIIEQIIRYLLKDPDYCHTATTKKERLFDNYIEKVRTTSSMLLKKIENEKKNSMVDDLAVSIFGTPSVFRLKNYSEANNEPFEKKSLAGFLYPRPLNFMKAFFVDFFKKDIREFSEVVIIRGKWISNVISNQYSDNYNDLMKITEELAEFDESLDEGTEKSGKLKASLLRCDKDADSARHLQSLLKEINKTAFNILKNGSEGLVQLAKNIKILVEDRDKSKPMLMMNWNEIDHYAEGRIKEKGIAIYKKIVQFAKLMRVFLQ